MSAVTDYTKHAEKNHAIPHRRTTINGITFDAPVAIKQTLDNKYAHIRRHGELVYALPQGCGFITESGVRFW